MVIPSLNTTQTSFSPAARASAQGRFKAAAGLRFGAESPQGAPAAGAAPKAGPAQKPSLLKDMFSAVTGLAIVEILLPFAVPIVLGMTLGLPLLGKMAGVKFGPAGELLNRMGVARRTWKVLKNIVTGPGRFVPARFKGRVLPYLEKAARGVTRQVFNFFKKDVVKGYMFVPKGFFPKIKHFGKKLLEVFGLVLRNRFTKNFKVLGQILTWLMGFGLFKWMTVDPAQTVRQVVQPVDTPKKPTAKPKPEASKPTPPKS